MRHAIEIRHETFVNEQFIQLLRRHGVGLVVADTVEWPLLMDLTSSFVYCRLHGNQELYASGYDSEALDIWARRIVTWAGAARSTTAEEQVNTMHQHESVAMSLSISTTICKVRAPFDAAQLRDRVLKLEKSRKN